jgi:predicted RNA-binding protein with TRAM domain
VHLIFPPVGLPSQGEGAVEVVPVLKGSNYQVKIDDLFAQKDGETVPDIRIKM